MTQRQFHRRRAFTLLEMVISTGLIVLLMSTTFWFYNAALAHRAKGALVSRNVQLARVVLERMAQEVRQAITTMPGYGVGVYGNQSDLGYGSALEINTLTLPDRQLSEVRGIREAKLAGQFDLRAVRYYVAWDDVNVDTNGNPRALGLVRRESRTYLRDVIFDDPDAETSDTEDAALGVKEELYAPEIKFFEVLFFDGAQWWDKWELTDGNPLPQLVRITIGFIPVVPEKTMQDLVDKNFLKEDEELEPLPADRYSVFVRLTQADLFFGSRLSRQASAFSESATAE